MNTYYEVITTFNDRGQVTAHLNTIQAQEMPENTFTRTSRKDIYHDYFKDLKVARIFIEEAKTV